MVNWYHKIIKAAADHHLMVDFHGAYPPSGWRRTYPNMMTREGILGNEYNKWSESVTPEHTVTILYTTESTRGNGLHTRRLPQPHAKEFQDGIRHKPPSRSAGYARSSAGSICLLREAPLHAFATPGSYPRSSRSGLPHQGPHCLDETKGLAGEIGEYAVIAKRSGEQWYVGAMTNWDERSMDLVLDFVEAGSYQVDIWEDGPKANKNAEDLATRSFALEAGSTLSLNLAPGGGAVIILTPVAE